jgi:hypothetical protein
MIAIGTSADVSFDLTGLCDLENNIALYATFSYYLRSEGESRLARRSCAPVLDAQPLFVWGLSSPSVIRLETATGHSQIDAIAPCAFECNVVAGGFSPTGVRFERSRARDFKSGVYHFIRDFGNCRLRRPN